jgi:monoamine oxidase
VDKLLAGLSVIDMRASRRGFLAGAAAFGAALASPRILKAAEATDVVIVGAGLAGLQAAMMLAAEGVKVLVLEADQRVGGRIRTLRDAPGRPDSGGSEVGPLYARTRRLVSDLSLGLYTRPPLPRGMAIHLGGELIAPDAWEASRHNRLPAALRAVQPYGIEAALMAKSQALADSEAWLLPEVDDGRYDRYLKSLGANRAALAFCTVGGQAPKLADMSALWMRRRDQIRRQSSGQGAVEFVAGGMDSLTSAMAAALGDSVRLGARVVAIGQTDSGVTVTTATGQQVRAGRAIVALPTTLLKDIRLDPLPPADQRRAWHGLPYGQATSIFFPVTQRFWEVDGLPPNLWSPTNIGRAFVISNDVGEHVWVYANGPAATRARRLPMPAMIEQARAELIAARPSMAGRIGQGSGFCWARNPLTRGTFAYRHPGGLAALQATLKQPLGRISFAGEHTADLAAGIEGALESGERAALEALA